MLSCDYNGWTDAPEDEREELDRYFSDVVRPDSRSTVATEKRAAMALTSQEASSRPGVAVPRRPLAPVLLHMLELAPRVMGAYLRRR
jgi:hypothetical protein